mmetsp:Transcript_25461/g.37614  ORF Transcript_25461/g.37614 Transcript_25461/m.37614 type:complete len:166 (-) Transcript_25461:888-1385(-)
MTKSAFIVLVSLCAVCVAGAFAPGRSFGITSTIPSSKQLTSLCMSDDFAADFTQDTPNSQTKEQIQNLVDEHPVLLFMKGTQLFPQCGFSNTAVQILNTFNLDFHSVDVLADQEIREGVKDFSQWPTIPQLYVAGEFVGGCDIMIEMYQDGELAEMIEKCKADMV